MSSQAQEWIDWQNQYFEDMAALGEGLVPQEVTFLDEAKNKVVGAAAAGVTIAALSGAAPAAAEASASAPIVRAMGIPVAVGSAPETTKPVEAKLAGQHIVERGESLSRIAGKLGVPLEHLKRANVADMPKPDLIFRGQIADYDPAKVSKAEPTQQMPDEGDIVVPIVKGDTLSELVVKHVPAISQESLAERVGRTANDNRISNIHVIYTGDNLIIKKAANKVAEAPGIVNPAPAAAAPQPEVVTAPIVEAPEPVVPSRPDPEGYVPPVLIDDPAPKPPEAAPAAAPPEAPPAPPKKPSERFNADAIPENFHGFGGIQIRADINRLMDVHNLAPNGAAQMSGTFLQEAGNDHRAENRGEGGYGLISANGGRRVGMPTESREAQIDFIVKQMQDDYPQVYKVLADYNSTPEQVRQAIKDFIRYGDEGNRTAWGQQLAYFLHVPKGTNPSPAFSVEAPAPPALAPAPIATPQRPAPAPPENFLPETGVNIRAAGANILVDVSAPAPPATLPPAPEAPPPPPGNNSLVKPNTERKESTGITTVEVGNGFRMDEAIADDLSRLLSAAEADGIALGEGSSLRTREEQLELREDNDCPSNPNAPSSTCRIPTAPPGKSMHEKGQAIDFTYGGHSIRKRDNPGFKWLAANAHKYGFKNFKKEPWHWSTNGR